MEHSGYLALLRSYEIAWGTLRIVTPNFLLDKVYKIGNNNSHWELIHIQSKNRIKRKLIIKEEGILLLYIPTVKADISDILSMQVTSFIVPVLTELEILVQFSLHLSIRKRVIDWWLIISSSYSCWISYCRNIYFWFIKYTLLF